jgi:hypothetical protein
MARVDYDRMAPDDLEGRALPPDGMDPWRAAIRPWLPAGRAGRSPALALEAETTPTPVVDRLDLLVLRRSA